MTITETGEASSAHDLLWSPQESPINTPKEEEMIWNHRHRFVKSDTDMLVVIAEAAASGDIESLRKLMQAGAHLDAGDYDERTPLHIVCAGAHASLDVARFFVEEVGSDVNAIDRWGFTPLQDALRAGHDDLIAYLRKQGARSGASPYLDIFSAAAVGDLPLLRRLVASGVDVNAGDFDQRRALHVASSEGLLDVVSFLVDEAGAHHSPADRWGNTPLGNALFGHKDEVAAFLRSRGAAGAIVATPELANNVFTLNDAASRGDLEALRRLVANGVNVNEGDYDSRCALHVAASEGNLDVVRYLVLEAHANHSPMDRWGFTPLADALRASHASVAQFLRGCGADECSLPPTPQGGNEDLWSSGLSGLGPSKQPHRSSPRRSTRSRTPRERHHNDRLAGSIIPPLMKRPHNPFICPLGEVPFQCPMVAPDGFTYEHAAFNAWVSRHGLISPITGEPMKSARLFPNKVISALLERRAAKYANKERLPLLAAEGGKVTYRSYLATALACVLIFGLVVVAAALLEGSEDGTLDGDVDYNETDWAFFYEGKDERVDSTWEKIEEKIDDDGR